MRYVDICETGNGPELKGTCKLLAFDGQAAVITYSDINSPIFVYTVIFAGANKADCLGEINVSVEKLNVPSDVDKDLLAATNSITKKTIKLENNAEGYLFSLSGK